MTAGLALKKKHMTNGTATVRTFAAITYGFLFPFEAAASFVPASANSPVLHSWPA